MRVWRFFVCESGRGRSFAGRVAGCEEGVEGEVSCGGDFWTS